MNRLHAFMVALEYLSIVSYSIKEGTVRYLRELEVFRHEQPGPAFLVRADRLIRRKVAELQADQKDENPTFSSALLEVLNDRKYLWNEARSLVTSAREQQKRFTSPEPRPRKDQGGSPVKTSQGSPSKRSRNRQNQKVKKNQLKGADAPRAHPPPAPQQISRPEAGSRPRCPDREWRMIIQMSRKAPARCKYYNCCIGCSFADASCKLKHACLECGGQHSWHAQHAKD